ncbi:MAG: hypothetical protein NDI75_07570 [Candidatus Didemnitutus sp.]|nr:hypothetical protein [Candidatus Didemnitutus sp.]
MRPLLDPSQLVKFNPPRVLSITIPAESESDVVPVTGRYIYPKEASYSKFDVRFDEGGYVPADLAFGFRVPDYMQAFRQVQFRNRNEVPITIEVIVGEIEVDDRRTNYIASRDGTAASFIPNRAQALGTTVANTPFAIAADPNRAEILISSEDFAVQTYFGIFLDAACTEFLMSEAIPPADNGYAANTVVRLPFKGACWILSYDVGVIVSQLCYS